LELSGLSYPKIDCHLKKILSSWLSSKELKTAAINIAVANNITGLSHNALSIALNKQEDINLRTNAILLVAPNKHAAELHDIAKNESGRLQRYALELLWPKHTSLRKILPHIKPNDDNFSLAFYWLYKETWEGKVSVKDIEFALEWIESHPEYIVDFGMEKVFKRIYYECGAFINELLPSLSDHIIEIEKLEYHYKIQNTWKEGSFFQVMSKEQTEKLISNCIQKWEDESQIFHLLYGIPNEVLSKITFEWVVKHIKTATDDPTKNKWAELLWIVTTKSTDKNGILEGDIFSKLYNLHHIEPINNLFSASYFVCNLCQAPQIRSSC